MVTKIIPEVISDKVVSEKPICKPFKNSSSDTKSITAIIKPTYACNLHCVYCYEGGRTDTNNKMSIRTAKKIMDELAQFHGPNNPIRIIWHGGEPLLMGIDFYDQVTTYQRDIGEDFEFVNSIQTNATLINNEIADFLISNNYKVGVSIDGPFWLHDRLRPYQNGNGSLADVMRGINLLRSKASVNSKENHVLGGVISVLNKLTAAHQRDVYHFCLDNKLDLKIIPLIYSGRASVSSFDYRITAEEYADALIPLFDEWYSASEWGISIDPFDKFIGNLVLQKPSGCEFSGECYFRFMDVSPTGDSFPCGRWGNEIKFKTGNINEDTVDDILSSPVISLFHEKRQKAYQLCSKCEYHSICNSGCVNNSYLVRNELSDRDYYCSGYKQLLTHIENNVKQTISEFPLAFGNLIIDSHPNTLHRAFEQGVEINKIEHPILQKILGTRVKDYISEMSNYGDHSKYSERVAWSQYPDYSDHKKSHSRYVVYSDGYLD